MKLDAAQRRALLADPAGWIACGFGSGLAPFAPGTFGSAAALLPWLLLRQLPLWGFLLAIAATFAIGVWASERSVAKLGLRDPGCIVIDEFVGLWLALLFVPPGWYWVLTAFLLFRLFDVWKPWPVSWADRNVHGGLGVMLDDAIAGAMAAGALAASHWAWLIYLS
jgi:phosphatidylglycerophosphatase A